MKQQDLITTTPDTSGRVAVPNADAFFALPFNELFDSRPWRGSPASALYSQAIVFRCGEKEFRFIKLRFEKSDPQALGGVRFIYSYQVQGFKMGHTTNELQAAIAFAYLNLGGKTHAETARQHTTP